MKWDCAQIEARLNDYLEGRLATEEQRAAQTHVETCSRCAEWLDARRARLWLQQVEPLEAPLGLETRILAQTTGLAARPSFWEMLTAGWRAFQQPRVALALAAALFSISLVLQAFDVDVRGISAADLHPANIYRKLDRTVYVAYGRGVKFFNDLRLVYEIRSRLDALKPLVKEPEKEQAPAPPTPSNENKNFSEDNERSTLYAYQPPKTTRSP